MTATLEPINYIERWRRMVVARREQHDAACAEADRTTGDYWARRAASYQKSVRETASWADPFLKHVRDHLRADDVVLDVGAGTGRHALPLSRSAGRVIALDPSAAMLGFLREEATAEGIDNIDIVEGGWPEIKEQTPAADVVVSAHVVYPIEDVVGFLQALDGHSKRACLLNLMVEQPWFEQLGLWEAVHGDVRRPQPTYRDVVNVLQQLGCHPNVQIDRVPVPRSFESLDDAVERTVETVAIGEDVELRGRLRDALAQRLERTPDGKLAVAAQPFQLATVWWEAGGLQSG